MHGFYCYAAQQVLTKASMFFHLLYIHLFRPFLKYDPQTSPIPANVSPRKLCIQAASLISKTIRLYKRTYGLRQICNIAVYFLHTACTIHLLSLPDKAAKGDLIHGLKHFEEIAEDWLCARRTLSILSISAQTWNVELPDEVAAILRRTNSRFGSFGSGDVPQSRSSSASPEVRKATALARSKQMEDQSTLAQQPQTKKEAPADQKIYMTSPNGPAKPQNPSGIHFVNVMAPPQVPSGATTHASPTELFGGIDAFADEQNWWMRDQATLAMGFDNWNGIDPVTGGVIPDGEGGFFMPEGGIGNGDVGMGEWYNEYADEDTV